VSASNALSMFVMENSKKEQIPKVIMYSEPSVECIDYVGGLIENSLSVFEKQQTP
jgi:hypothetical protein